MGLLDGFFSLGSDTNKVGSDQSESTITDLLPELTLDMEDEELLALARDWKKNWEPYEAEIAKKQTENENYWLGKQFGSGVNQPIDNLIFESLETFLPIATRPKADPIVEADNTDDGNAIADKVRKMLAYLSDTLSYNLKVKQVARYWALYMLGAMKVGWSMKENDITCVALRPQKLILDPKATIDCGEYTGYYVGEHITDDLASELVARFPKQEKYITDKVHGKMGSKVPYVMWTTDDYVFWQLDDQILDKNKNPHWNYEQQIPEQQSVDEIGQPVVQPARTIPGNNHFNTPKKPYIFLSFFNLGKHPHDDTNLIQQNISLQDLVNKRLIQMDKNADNANGGLIVSGDAFTEEQAEKAAKALRKGGVVWVPTGDVNNSVKRDVGTPLPNFIYESLNDYRGELRNIFGIRGSSPQGLSGERTVRGKMFMQQQDQSRIGGGISTALEEFTDYAYNWFVQLMYVYYDEPHMASVVGPESAKEYIQLSNKELNRKLSVGVKEGSMIPKDPASKREEAIDLWTKKGIDPITFFDRLEFPNPRESAKQLYLWLSDPVQLFPDLAAQQQPQQTEKPSESINYKDLPPEGQSQMAAQAGIQLHPQQIADHQAQQDAQAAAQKQQEIQAKQSQFKTLTNNP